MNAAATKMEYRNPEPPRQETPLPMPSMGGQWLNILGAVILAALFMCVIASAQVWLRLDIDNTYQKIDDYKIKNARLTADIEKLEAQFNSLQSFESIEKNLVEAGVIMHSPEQVFYVDPGRATGALALTSNEPHKDPI
jgi:cell division protein FtsB